MPGESMIHVRVDPELKALIERLAKEDHRSTSGLILHILLDYIAQKQRGTPKKKNT